MKRKWLKRTMALVLSSVMAAGMLAGCGQNDEVKSNATETQTVKESESTPATEQSSEVVKEEVTYPLDTDVELSLFVSKGINVADVFASADDSVWHSGLEKNTGVDIDWQFPAKGTDANTALNLMWQEEKLPNIIFGQNTVSSAITWYEDGLIYDLTPYLEEYAPNYWEYIHRPEFEEELKNITTDDGKIVVFSSFKDSQYNNTYLGPVIRQDWLDECGLKAPVTLEDWENVLVTFKEKYGATFGFRRGRYNEGGGISSGTGAFAAFYPNYYLDENNKVCYGTSGPEWKEMLETFSRWYEMGLIDPDFATSDDASVRAKVLDNKIGVSFTAMSQLTNWMVDAEAEGTGAQWVGFAYPVTEPGAPVAYHNINRTLNSTYNAVISIDSTEEELITALQFLDYGFTEEGMMYHNFGEEGEVYTVDANGNISWTDLITKDESGLDAAVKKYTGTHTGELATVQLAEYVKMKNRDESADAVYVWIENSTAQQHKMPAVTLTPEEQAIYTDLNAALNTYVDEWALKFATGKESLDKYEEFEKTLYEMGLQQCLDIQQAAVDRYFAR